MNRGLDGGGVYFESGKSYDGYIFVKNASSMALCGNWL